MGHASGTLGKAQYADLKEEEREWENLAASRDTNNPSGAHTLPAVGVMNTRPQVVAGF